MDTLNLDRPAGVFAAVLTPFDEAGAPDSAALALHCRWLLRNGCDGLSVLGTTGEGNSLSVEERLALLERLVSDGIPARVLLPGTGCCAIPDTVRLTERAVQLGAPGGTDAAAVLLQERQRGWTVRRVRRGPRARRRQSAAHLPLSLPADVGRVSDARARSSVCWRVIPTASPA